LWPNVGGTSTGPAVNGLNPLGGAPDGQQAKGKSRPCGTPGEELEAF